MAKVNKIRGKMAENGVSVEHLADGIRVDASTFYRRLKDDGETFTIREAKAIVKALNFTKSEASDIFLDD